MKDTLIISDSITRDFADLRRIEVITLRGANIIDVDKYIRKKPDELTKENYRIIIVHVGTNWFGTKFEWKQYKKYIKGYITYSRYLSIIMSNPDPAQGPAMVFKQQMQNLVDFIRSKSNARILLSSILPRPCDDTCRRQVVNIYNRLFKEINFATYIETGKYFRFYQDDNSIVDEFFDEDGLHLSEKGTKILQSLFGDYLERALSNRI